MYRKTENILLILLIAISFTSFANTFSRKPNFSGLMKIDQTFFMGSSNNLRSDYPSSSLLRSAEIYIGGLLGKELHYSTGISFDAGNKISIGDAFIKWTNIYPRTSLAIGQVSPSFSLESSNSSKWLPFLERSTPVSAFSGSQGLGFRVAHWWDSGMINISAIQDNANNLKDISQYSGKWDLSSRLVFNPINTASSLYHIGASINYRDTRDTSTAGNPRARFKTYPEARARSIIQDLDTGKMRAKHYFIYSLEAEGRWGPLNIETEFLKSTVSRRFNNNGNLKFYGWFAQANYFLTGETRLYDAKSGTFKGATPNSEYGAWQISSRYSYLNLNSKDIQGGVARNISIGLSWFINNNLRTLCNLIRTSVNPKSNAAKRNFYTLSFRIQTVF